MGSTRLSRRALLGGAGSLLLLATAGCQPEQRPGTVETIGSASGSVSASVSGISGSVSGAPKTGSVSGAPGTKTAAAVTPGDEIYTPMSNVDIYQLISLDVAEIGRLTNAVLEGNPLPTDEILAIYEQGRHAKIGEQSRALRRFATDPARAEEFADEATFYQSGTFLDDSVIAAINGTGSAASYSPTQRRQAIQKGLLRILKYYSVHELNGGERKLADGNVDPASGAPHNVDEAWAIYVGAAQDGKYPYALAATAQSREGNFDRVGTVDKPLREALARAEKAALDKSTSAFAEARADIHSRFNALFYLAAARYLNESAKSVAAGKIDDARAQLIEGFSFYQTIQPVVASADASADQTLVGFYQSADPSTLTTDDRDNALEALNRAAAALQLADSDLLTAADFS